MVPVLVGVTLIVFILMNSIPGDPVLVMYGDPTSVGDTATPEELDRIREIYGLNDPLPMQYINWVGRILVGDFGQSIVTRTPVRDSILGRIPATLQLSAGALLVGLIVAIPLGIGAAVSKNGILDRVSLAVSSLTISVPNFWIALILIVLFSVYLGWLPTGGRPETGLTRSFVLLLQGEWQLVWAWIRHSIMPVVSLSTTIIPPVIRITRYSMLEVLNSDYIRTARAKGLREYLVVYRHALRNALIPVTTIVGLQIAFLLSGAVLIETIFRWPGLGQLAYQSIQRQDYPVVQGTILVVAVIFATLNLSIDVLYAFIDPRIRYE